MCALPYATSSSTPALELFHTRLSVTPGSAHVSVSKGQSVHSREYTDASRARASCEPQDDVSMADAHMQVGRARGCARADGVGV